MSNSDLFLLQEDHDDDDPNVPLSLLDKCHRHTSPLDQEDDNFDHHHHDQEYGHEALGQRDEQGYDEDDNDDQQALKAKDLEVEAKKKEEKEEVLEQITYAEECLKMAPSPAGELALQVDDNDDGFTTPTSLDHKIPVRQQCPSAPRKLKISLKRKAAPSSGRTSTACRTLQLDFSEQIESMFPDLQCHRKIKKSRRADQQAE